MARKKKETKVEEVTTIEPTIEVSVPIPKVVPLELNLGRDDFNAVVAKLNEVIKEINK